MIENPVGYLQVVYTAFIKLDVVHFPLIFDHVLLDNQVKKDSKHVYGNFLKDCQMQAYYDLSYVQYMEQLIDDLIMIQDDLDLTKKNEIHLMYGKNSHTSDKSLVTDRPSFCPVANCY